MKAFATKFRSFVGRMRAVRPLHTLRRWRTEGPTRIAASAAYLPGLTDLRLRRQARPWCAELAAVGPMLTELSDEVEQRFLACGSALQEQVRITSQLVTQGRKLGQLATGADDHESAVTRIGSFLSTHLHLSDELAAEVEGLAATLDRYGGHLQHLLGEQQQLERSFAPMRVLHSLFRIESAALTVEQKAQFHAVTAEMDRLHTDVAANFAAHAAALHQTRERVLAAAAELHARATQLRDGTRHERAGVERALERLHAQLEQNRRRQHQLETAIAALNRETDTIAVGLQYQDITRQKLAHVTTAAESLLAEFVAKSAPPLRRRAGVQHLLCEVQVAQLTSVQDELELATGSISTGLQALLDQLQRIERDCLSVANLRAITSEMDAAADDARAIYATTTRLVGDALAGLSRAIDTAQGLATATTGATDTMRRLAADLLLMGLNAQVQALQAKNGCLEVLSSAASNISSEAGALTLSFEAKLAATTTTLSTFVQRTQSTHASTRARHEALAAQHAAVLADFAREHEATKPLIAEVGALLQELAHQTDALLSSIDLAEFSREPIARAREVFVALARVFGAAAADRPADDAAALAAVHDRYTMSSERAAHAAAVASVARPASIPPSAPADLAAPELAAVAGLPSTGAPAAAPLGDNVELF